MIYKVLLIIWKVFTPLKYNRDSVTRVTVIPIYSVISGFSDISNMAENENSEMPEINGNQKPPVANIANTTELLSSFIDRFALIILSKISRIFP